MSRWTQRSQERQAWRTNKTPRDLWTQRDQDQNDDTKPHCCGVCQDSPAGNHGQGLL